MKKFVIILFGWVLALQAPVSLFAQEVEDSTAQNRPLKAFLAGKAEVHFRNYFMGTVNEGALRDFHSWAFGGGLKYESGSFHGFQFTASGFFIFNLASSDLRIPDATTGSFSRYESGQFDVTDLSNRNNMDRLEEFNISYHSRGHSLLFGKTIPRTPFINPQDGRMRPTGIQGLMFRSRDSSRLRVEAGLYDRISPRSTVEWFDIGASIGVYSQGLNVTGLPSNYRDRLKSDWIGMAGIQYKTLHGLHLQVWSTWVDQLMHTGLLQADLEHSLGKENTLIAGVQYTRQDPVAGGGRLDSLHSYFQEGTHSNVWSGRLGLRSRLWTVQANYTRVGAAGRFLFPREWGREPFYTFLSRERVEGAGDVHAVSVNLQRRFPERHSLAGLSAGYYRMPDVKHYRLNKYGMPTFLQVNAEFKHRFQGFFQGLQAEVLLVYKRALGETYGDARYLINKTNMFQYNLILNYQFG